MAYTTNTLVKTLLGLSDSTDDTLLTNLIAQAQSIIDAYTGCTFEASANTTRYFDAVQDVRGLVLRLGTDLCSIESITNGDGTTITSGQYVTEPRNGTPYHRIKLLQSAGVAWTYSTDPEDAIAISGKWAYSESAPAGIVRACQEMTVLFYRQRDTNSDLNRTIIAGNATILPVGLSKTTETYLRAMRRML